jgi:hypothetical protein
VIVFDCECKYRFIIGNKKIYGPIGPDLKARMMTHLEWIEDYGDCYAERIREMEGLARRWRGCHEDVTRLLPLCYLPHFNRHDQGLPNPKYLPHVHAIIWKEP